MIRDACIQRDRWIGDLLGRAGSESTVMVLGDHVHGRRPVNIVKLNEHLAKKWTLHCERVRRWPDLSRNRATHDHSPPRHWEISPGEFRSGHPQCPLEVAGVCITPARGRLELHSGAFVGSLRRQLLLFRRHQDKDRPPHRHLPLHQEPNRIRFPRPERTSRQPPNRRAGAIGIRALSGPSYWPIPGCPLSAIGRVGCEIFPARDSLRGIRTPGDSTRNPQNSVPS